MSGLKPRVKTDVIPLQVGEVIDPKFNWFIMDGERGLDESPIPVGESWNPNTDFPEDLKACHLSFMGHIGLETLESKFVITEVHEPVKSHDGHNPRQEMPSGHGYVAEEIDERHIPVENGVKITFHTAQGFRDAVPSLHRTKIADRFLKQRQQ